MKNTFNQEYIMKNFFKKVKNTLAHIPFMTDVIAMYFCAIDNTVPLSIKITIFSALTYFINPIDIIPELAPGGYSDDVAALLGALKLAEVYITDTHRFKAKQWLYS